MQSKRWSKTNKDYTYLCTSEFTVLVKSKRKYKA